MKIFKSLFTIPITLLFLYSCSDDPQVFDGITIGGKVTNIQLTEATVSEIEDTTATVSSAATRLDGNVPVTEHGHVWSSSNTKPTISNNRSELGALNEPDDIVSELTGLQPNTIYYVRTYVTTSIGTGYSDQVDVFQTGDTPGDVLIINEGNFTDGNGSLTGYNSLNEDIGFSLFATANGFPIGGIIQGAEFYNERLYLVTAAPDKLEIVDALTFESIGVIQGTFDDGSPVFFNPSEFEAIGDIGYVTNWGDFDGDPAPFLTRINLVTLEGIDAIPLTGFPQDILALDGDLYISNEFASEIQVLDTADNSLAPIVTEPGPSAFTVDVNGNIWAVCTSGSLVQIDPGAGQVIKTIQNADVRGFDEKVYISNDSTLIYWLSAEAFPNAGTKVYEMSINATNAPGAPLIDGENFYAIGVHPTSSLIYLGDSKAFQAAGEVEIYTPGGTRTSTFDTGFGPNKFLFRR